MAGESSGSVDSPLPHRVQLRRTKGWRTPADTVRVCRPGEWGNPFKVGTDGVASSAFAVQLYRDWIMVPAQGPLRRKLGDLRGKNLACWCKPGTPCHADVLLEIANAT